MHRVLRDPRARAVRCMRFLVVAAALAIGRRRDHDSSIAASVLLFANSCCKASTRNKTHRRTKCRCASRHFRRRSAAGSCSCFLRSSCASLLRVAHRSGHIGDAEVGELHLPVPREQDVSRETISVHDVRAVARVVDAKLCAYPSRGPRCSRCTPRAGRSRLADRAMMVDHRAAASRPRITPSPIKTGLEFFELVDLHDGLPCI